MLTDDELYKAFADGAVGAPLGPYFVGGLRAVERAVLRKAAADFAARRFFVAQDGFLVETEPTLTVNDVAAWLLGQAGGGEC